MAAATSRPPRQGINPVYAVLLCGMLPLFMGALLSDWAYWSTYQLQWTNFASWLNVGGVIFAAAALVWALTDFFRAGSGKGVLRTTSLLVLLTTFVVGVINALVHAKDGWAAMPAGLILSIVVLLLAVVAIWLGFSSKRGSASP